MGNQCLASTPIEHYQSYFDIKVSEIKDYWTTMQVYKIKKLYDSVATKHPEYSKHTHLELDRFLTLFPGFSSFPERQKVRVFQIFNFDGHGFVDWDNFYSMISVCYFCKEQTLAVILFLIFDESLSKELNVAELELLCETNQECILMTEDSGEQTPLYTPEEVVEKMLDGSKSIKLSEWLEKCPKFFLIARFRRLFNIFIEEKLEKELIRNFSDWNNLYVEDEDRYVSYLINFKWFQTWKIYVKQEYGIALSNNSKKPATFKTKKMFNSFGKLNKKKKIADALTLRQLKIQMPERPKEEKDQDDDLPEKLKNFDFIHSNIGEKPNEIYNKVLEGDFEQVLSQEIIENRDYVLISEKVWKYLKRIYDGYPEFRRTGFDFIELYPKILKVLSFSKGVIEYRDDNMKEVSAYYGLGDIMEAVIGSNNVHSKKIYFKTIGMPKWEEVTDYSIALGELSMEVIIFLVVVNQEDKEIFQKNCIKPSPQTITEINVGDEIRFEHSIKKAEVGMVFLGKNVEGKYILHVPGEPYIFDICVLESELCKKGKLVSSKDSNQIIPIKMKKKDELGLVGIPNTKGLGFINSVLMHLYYNWAFKQQLSLFPQEEVPSEEKKFVKTLAKTFRDLTYKKKIDTKLIQQTIDELLPDFRHFSTDMCQQFMNKFFALLKEELLQLGLKDNITNYQIKTERETECKKCNNHLKEEQTKFILSVPLRTNTEKYYQIIYVPYSDTIKILDMKRYGFKLKAGALMQDYKQAFEEVAGLAPDTKYLLMEVYCNSIVKNYSTAKTDASLDELLLRDTDTIYAYELKIDFSDFINKHYSRSVDFENKELKIDQFIDCKNSTRGWILGKICEKDFSPYGHRTVIRVIHKFSKGEHWEISYDVDDFSVANFPTRSYLNGEQYHLRLLQRYFVEASNDMEICNIPLVVVLTNWMRWREFYYLIYLQVKKFIKFDEGEFDDEDEAHIGISSSKSITSRGGKKKTNKVRLNKFKDYLYGPKFPYKLSFIDYSGRCAICFKFLKSQVFQGEETTYCVGCELSPKEPISWQIKASDVQVCVDWKDLNYFKRDIIKDHSSYANMMVDRKNDIETIENCLDNLVQGCPEPLEQMCCNIQTETIVKEKILEYPSNLNIFIERIVEENGFITIINKHVKFQDQLTLNSNVYKLVGLTSIDGGSNKSNKFRAFVNVSEDEWLEYDGNVVRSVKRNYVDKLTALNLFYKRKQA